MKLEKGQRVVYPGQGIHRVDGVDELEIGGVRQTFVSLRRERDGATVRIPEARVSRVGLRPLATRDEAIAALEHLRAPESDPELDWKRRQRAHQDLIADGGLMGIARVLRTLHAISCVRALPDKERAIYDQMRDLLVEEFAVVLELPAGAVEDQIDLALDPPAKPARRSGTGKKAASKKTASKKTASKKTASKKAASKKAAPKKAASKKTSSKKAAPKKTAASSRRKKRSARS